MLNTFDFKKGVWGRMDTCVCMAESLCCSPETTTTLLMGYTPIQNKKLFFFLKGVEKMRLNLHPKISR